LQEAADNLGNQVDTQVLVCEGRPAEEILKTASRLGADTIVMATHGRRGWRTWLHRNTAARVARQATCNLWLVSAKESDASVSLTMLDRAHFNRRSERWAIRADRLQSRSLLHVLFS
jgi:hypothetical protein